MEEKVIIILPEDADKITEQLKPVIRALESGVAQRITNDLFLGEDYSPMEVIGYWVSNTIKLEIKIKEEADESNQRDTEQPK